jgi:hypothetical protein
MSAMSVSEPIQLGGWQLNFATAPLPKISSARKFH